MRFQSLSMFLLASAFVVGCGGAKLTEEQKAKFKDLQKSTSSVISSAKSANSGSTKAIGDNDSFESRFQEKVNGHCNFNMPTAANPASMGTINLKIDGPQCPILMEIGATGSQTEAQIRIYFEIKDADLAKISDVTKMDLSGSMKGSQDSASGSLRGTILSKKYGSVGITMNVSGNQNQITMEATYTFADFSVTLGVEESASGTKYKINGASVSAEEFQAVMNGGSLVPGSSAGQMSGGNAPPIAPVPPISPPNSNSSNLSYNLTYNDCSTGQQTFMSEAALCAGLQEESRNNNCAQDLRRLTFQSRACPGTFQVQP